MSYGDAIAALVTAFEAVSGINRVLDYEPTAIHEPPMMYLIADSGERSSTVQPVLETYRVLATLVIRWQDNEQAEREVITLLPGILAALDADPSLGEVLGGGAAWITGYDAGYATIGGTIYRTVEFRVEVSAVTC